MERVLNSNTTYRRFRRSLIEGEVDVIFQDRLYRNLRSYNIPDSPAVVKIKKDLPLEEKVVSLFHELFHLHQPFADEELVENQAVYMYENLSWGRLGFFEFVLTQD